MRLLGFVCNSFNLHAQTVNWGERQSRLLCLEGDGSNQGSAEVIWTSIAHPVRQNS